MAILKRSKTMVLGLNSDLQALATADSNEAQARTDADDALQANIDTEVQDRTDAIDATNKTVADNKDELQTNIDKEVQDRKDAIADLDAASSDAIDAVQANLDTEVQDRKDAVTDLQGKIDNIIENTDEEALDSLKEIVDAFKNADNDINTAISDLADAREKALNDAVAAQDEVNKAHDDKDAELEQAIKDEADARTKAVDDEHTAMTDAVATALKKEDNLSDVTDAAAARANISVDSSAEVSEKVRLGGAKFYTELLEVDSDAITISNVAKNDMIFNFATVRNVDDAGVASDIPVTVDEAGSKVYNLHPDEEGQFDGKKVMVQYAYIPAS